MRHPSKTDFMRMKNFNLVLRATLLFLLSLGTATSALAYDFIKGSIYYNITGANTVEVTWNTSHKFSGSYSGSVTIPSKITYGGKTYSVTGIGGFAFRYCYDLTSVTIPNTVTYISDYAFQYCYDLTSVTIPNSVNHIGRSAFEDCI